MKGIGTDPNYMLSILESNRFFNNEYPEMKAYYDGSRGELEYLAQLVENNIL